ncbi:MAG: thiamine pyrophosphate-binding protein [Anaerolineae bacterium]
MKASDYVASFLAAQGVEYVFEMIGGMITHLVDSIHRQGRIRLVSVHHEQAAAFAAEAAARMTGVPGVAMATSGPGATNLLTGIASCYFDSTPAVFITGQVNRGEQKGDRPIRQLGFQETDIVPMAAPVTKAAWGIRSAEELPARLRSAFQLALEGRPGPVLLDIPMDVQRLEITDPSPATVPESVLAPADCQTVAELLAILGRAERPLILAGGGLRASRSVDLFREFVERSGVPVVTSLMGLDALAYDHPQRVGFIGTYGNRWANMTLGSCDVLLVLGSRLDIRQTGADIGAFQQGRTILHVDCDSPELNNRLQGCQAVVSHLRPFLTAAVAVLGGEALPPRSGWQRQIESWRLRWPDTAELPNVSGINPNILMHELSARSRPAAAFTVDVGQHQMWAAQSLEVGTDQRFITSGGMGAMGFALPAAVGVALAGRGRPVVAIAGDGAFQVNVQELQTVAHHALPVKMVVINNGALGMVRQFQQEYFEGRCQSTVWGYSAPDFTRVAQAYGIPARSVADPAGVGAGLDWLWEAPGCPALLQVMVDASTNTYPKISFGQPLTRMEPKAG